VPDPREHSGRADASVIVAPDERPFRWIDLLGLSPSRHSSDLGRGIAGLEEVRVADPERCPAQRRLRRLAARLG